MDRTLFNMMIVFFLSVGLFASYVLLNKPLTRLTRASTEGTPSAQNSLMFAWPLKVSADGKTPITITVFARNYNGRAIPGKSVTLTTNFGKLQQTTITTDTEGKSLFRITSDSPGVAEIKAMIDNIEVQRTISVKFE